MATRPLPLTPLPIPSPLLLTLTVSLPIPSPLLLTLTVSLTFLLLIFPRPASSQAAPALLGQGVDPVNAKVSKSPVPVFMSVELVKLVEVNQQNYQFTPVLKFAQSWYDPRAAQTYPIIMSVSEQKLREHQKAIVDCAAAAKDNASGEVNLTSDACKEATSEPPPCGRFCSVWGSDSTDNPYLCCDDVWLPSFELRNMLDMSQDRLVSDLVWAFNVSDDEPRPCVHRQTLVTGRYYAAFDFSKFPFDKQRLQVFVDAYADVSEDGDPNFYIVPSATMRRFNQKLVMVDNRTAEVRGLNSDELAGWNITAFTFACVNGTGGNNMTGSKNRPLEVVTQPAAENDIYSDYYEASNGSFANVANSLAQTCTISIEITRLAQTTVIQSVLPVAFIGFLSFTVFFTPPDDAEVRLGTEITLFLSLTAVQFVFTSILPTTSYLTDFDVYILLNYCLIVGIVLENLVAFYICTRKEHWERKGGYSAQSPVDGEAKGSPHGKDPESMQQTGIANYIPFSTTRSRHYARDPEKAYRIACLLDKVCGLLFFVVYVILSVISFTVGL